MSASEGDSDSNLPATLLTLVIASIILFVGITAVSGVIDSTVAGEGADDSVQTAGLLDGTNFSEIDGGGSWGVDETVYDSRGYAVELAGTNDSYIRSTENIDVNTAENFTVSVWASYESTTEEMTALSLDGRVDIAYNGTTGNWSAWYYDDGSRTSYEVEVPSNASAGDLENIVVTREGDALSIYQNNSDSNSVTISGSGSVDAPINRTNWDGRLEEVRVDEDAWSSSTRQSHYDNPIDPTATNQTARVMFDEPYRDTQRLFYNDGNIETSNVSFVDGHPGQELSSSGDYDWNRDGPRIRAEGGGEIDGAPVAYVDYTDRGFITGLRSGFTSAVGLAGILLILVPVGIIIAYMYGFRNGR